MVQPRTGGVLDLVADVRAEHEQLRHAARIAQVAHPVFFGDHDLGVEGSMRAARTPPEKNFTADDEEIDVELSHCQPLFILPSPALLRGLGLGDGPSLF